MEIQNSHLHHSQWNNLLTSQQQEGSTLRTCLRLGESSGQLMKPTNCHRSSWENNFTEKQDPILACCGAAPRVVAQCQGVQCNIMWINELKERENRDGKRCSTQNSNSTMNVGTKIWSAPHAANRFFHATSLFGEWRRKTADVNAKEKARGAHFYFQVCWPSVDFVYYYENKNADIGIWIHHQSCHMSCDKKIKHILLNQTTKRCC